MKLLLRLQFLIALLIISLGAKSQSSAAIVTTPTALNYSTTVGLPVEKDVNVKTAGISSLAVLTSFKAIVQGPNSNQFSAVVPSLSLIDLLNALLGNGINIKVTYNPTVEGDHTAELLIETALLGVLLPVQTTVPISAESFDPPVIESTSPADEATNVPVGTTAINIYFDKSISIKDATKIKLNGMPVSSSVERSLLTLNVSPGLKRASLYTVTIEAGAISANAGYSINVQDYSFSFSTPLADPTYTITPIPGSIIYIDYPSQTFYINIQFSEPVLPHGTAINSSGNYISVVRPTDDNTVITLETTSLPPTGGLNDPSVELSIPAGTITDEGGNPLDAIYVGTYTVYAGPHVINIDPYPNEDEPLTTTTDNFQQTITFTFSQNIARIGDSTPVTIPFTKGISLQSYSIDGNKLIVVVSGTVTSNDYFTITIPAETLSSYDPYLIPNLEESATFNVIRINNSSRTTLSNDIENKNISSDITSENYYTVTGVQISKNNLQSGSIYIKKTSYKDGSVYTEKIIYQDAR